MSEIRLNLIDSQHILHGTIHGSIGDACVAALSAEPETIAELEAALTRYQKPLDETRPFALFHATGTIDERLWDAGILILDLAARIVAYDSTYSQPGPTGQVTYHDGVCATDVAVWYRVPGDWIFLNSIEEYEGLRDERREERAARPPLDTRAVLYGRPLLEFIAQSVAQTSVAEINPQAEIGNRQCSAIHARWLMTPRDDLRGQSPRDVLLARQDFIDHDLDSRETQWSLLREGPPCIPISSFAYRFAGFGTHEWVVYYDLVRHLLWSALGWPRFAPTEASSQTEDPPTDLSREWPQEIEAQIALLEQLKTDWLEQPQPEFDGGIPALYIENERKRLPLAMLGRDMVIDENCPMCRMMADETGLGLEVGFCHLDGSHMDQDFAFSNFRTREEWEADRRRWEAFSEQHKRERKEPEHCPAQDEPGDPF